MNPPRCDDLDYIQFLIAAQRVFSCCEAARCQPERATAPAHDAFTRLLRRQPPDTEALWQEVQGAIVPHQGVLVLDDTTLDKPYAQQMGLVTRHWSGLHRRVVLGINLLTLLWSDGEACIPCDCRIYDKPFGGLTKNQHFQAMLHRAHARGFAPEWVLVDSWYASLENLKTIRQLHWRWLTRLKRNRRVNPDGLGNVLLDTLSLGPEGQVVHLQGYGFIKVFQTVGQDGDVEYWASSELAWGAGEREDLSRQARSIETYHRGLKQCCGVAQAQVRQEQAQRNHILLALRAFLRLELHRLRTGVSWHEAKTVIVREAIRQYLAHPSYSLQPTA
jgi:putative transposase